MTVHVIGDRETVLGMQLVGVSGKTAESREEALDALDQALSDDRIQLLLITRKMAEQMRQQVDRLKMKRLSPIIIEIPGKDLKPPEQSMAEMVRRAIGISV